jgi:hypothetical protein
MFGIQKSLTKILYFTGSVKDTLRCYLKVKPTILVLKNQENKKLIVLGNGPSLKDVITNNINIFIDKDSICCNEFAQSDYYEIIKPKYYVFTDPAYWRISDIQKVKDDLHHTFNSIKEKTNWPIILLINIAGSKWNHFMELEKVNSNIKIIYFYNNNVEASKKIRYSLYKKNRAMPLLYNVLGVSVYLGLTLGYRKIFLLGADHSWLKDLIVKDDNILYMRNRHFYDKEEAPANPMYVDSHCQRTFRMHEILTALSCTFKGYLELEDYSKFLNSKILNATKGSFIDAFERISPDKI